MTISPALQETKKPWRSLTTYTTILLAALSGAQSAGVVPEGADGAVSGLVAAVLGVLALFGRSRAKGPLSL